GPRGQLRAARGLLPPRARQHPDAARRGDQPDRAHPSGGGRAPGGGAGGEGPPEEEPVDRAVFDLPEPWRLVEPVASVLRPGGIFLSYVPTIIQSHQLTETPPLHPG